MSMYSPFFVDFRKDSHIIQFVPAKLEEKRKGQMEEDFGGDFS